jgi:hypothetical protein
MMICTEICIIIKGKRERVRERNKGSWTDQNTLYSHLTYIEKSLSTLTGTKNERQVGLWNRCGGGGVLYWQRSEWRKWRKVNIINVLCIHEIEQLNFLQLFCVSCRGCGRRDSGANPVNVQCNAMNSPCPINVY